MDFRIIQDFPAGLATLWASVGRPDYPREKYLALGSMAVLLRAFRATPRAIDVELDRDVPVDPARWPPWARAFAGRTLTLQHHTRWRRVGPLSAAAEIDIAPVGLPVRAHGTGAIAQTTPHSTRMTLDWRVTSRVPVVGRSIERLFAREVREALEADHAFTLDYLRRSTMASAA